jgi:hypothetical protein
MTEGTVTFEEIFDLVPIAVVLRSARAYTLSHTATWSHKWHQSAEEWR